MSVTVRDIGAKTKRREPNQLFTDPADFRAPSPLEEGGRRRREGGGGDQVKNGTAQVVWAEKDHLPQPLSKLSPSETAQILPQPLSKKDQGGSAAGEEKI